MRITSTVCLRCGVTSSVETKEYSGFVADSGGAMIRASAPYSYERHKRVFSDAARLLGAEPCSCCDLLADSAEGLRIRRAHRERNRLPRFIRW